MEHTSPDTPGTTHHLIITIGLWLSAFIFNWLGDITANDIFTWVFRGLSAASIIVTLYINWPKAVEQYRSNKKKKENDRSRKKK